MRIRSFLLRMSSIFGLIIVLCFFSSRLYDYKFKSWRTGGWTNTPEVYPNQVQRLEWSTEPPDQKITFWCSANRTIDAYIMTGDQYQALRSTNIEPTEYIYHYAGQNINVTFISSLEGAVRYNFVIYPKSSPILVYSQGTVTEHQILKRQVDLNYLVLDLLAAAILFSIAIYPYLDEGHKSQLLDPLDSPT
jgi:hypothetical protein